MENLNYWLIGTSILQILVAGYLIYFKSYLVRKATNYADKEDIAEITDQIETVKRQYTTELATLNAKLSLTSTVKKSYREREFEVIADLFDVCNSFVHEYLIINLTWFDRKHLEDIIKRQEMCFEQNNKIITSKGKFTLYVNGVQLRQSAFKLTQVCIIHSNKVGRMLLDLAYVLREEGDLIESVNKIWKQTKGPIENEKEIIEQDKIIKKRIEQIRNEYQELRRTHHPEVTQAFAEFESEARKYLLNID